MTIGAFAGGPVIDPGTCKRRHNQPSARSLRPSLHQEHCVRGQERTDDQIPANTQVDECRHDHHRSADGPDHFQELHIPLPVEVED